MTLTMLLNWQRLSASGERGCYGAIADRAWALIFWEGTAIADSGSSVEGDRDRSRNG